MTGTQLRQVVSGGMFFDIFLPVLTLNHYLLIDCNRIALLPLHTPQGAGAKEQPVYLNIFGLEFYAIL